MGIYKVGYKPAQSLWRVFLNLLHDFSTQRSFGNNFSRSGMSYLHVCERVNQKGSPDAFDPSNLGLEPGLEGVYIDGVSLTHGAAGSHQHI